VKSIVAVGVLVLGLIAAKEGAPVLLLAALGVALVLAGGARKLAVRGHSHAGDKPKSARHEAGHAAAARALGGKVHSATLNRDGTGYVDATLPRDDARDALVFLMAGRKAAGTSRGAGHDKAAEARILAKVPADQRAKVRRTAERQASRVVSAQSGRIRRDAATLMERGRL
jgi:hypothetical protein